MKNAIAILICFICYNVAFTQDTNLYQTWYLYQLEVDIDGVVWDIENVQPNFSPTLIINNDLTFEGTGACNGFSGNYTFDSSTNSINPINFNRTLVDCNTDEENNFETNFFNTVSANTDHTIALSSTTDYMQLKLENYPGYAATYRNVSLSVNYDDLVQLNIYPNPVIDQLNILYQGSNTLSATVYDVYGKSIFQVKNVNTLIDLSELSRGIYFLELTSGREKTIKKIIKY